MKVAIIADIHGNLQALDAVLADLETVGPDRLVINGDLVNRGPDSVAVMRRLDGLAAAVTLGNHDDLMIKWFDRSSDLPAEWFDDPFWSSTGWTAQRLADSGLLDRLRVLPMHHRIEVAGAPSLLITHGSPRHYREGYGRFLSDAHIEEIVQRYPADLYIGSHTHQPFERAWGRHLFLNTGAVGAPFNGDPRAQYLLLTLQDGRWRHERRLVAYPREQTLAAFHDSGFLDEGGLSARIFYEELRYSCPLLMPYLMWTEKEGQSYSEERWESFLPSFLDRVRAYRSVPPQPFREELP